MDEWVAVVARPDKKSHPQAIDYQIRGCCVGTERRQCKCTWSARSIHSWVVVAVVVQSVSHSFTQPAQPAPTNIAVQHKEAPLAKSSLSLNLWNNRRVALILWYPTWNYSRCALKSSSSASYYAGVDRLIGGRYWRKEEQKRALNLQQLKIRSHENHLKEGIDNNFSKFVR